MKSLDELLLAWRDESITADELKELERLLAEPANRERLYDEFVGTATLVEALKVSAAAPELPRSAPPRVTPLPARRYLAWSAAAVLLFCAGATYFYLANMAVKPHGGFELVSGSALVNEKRDGSISDSSVVACDAGNAATIRFPDGSMMDLASSSSSILHSRSVELKSGKASFQIQKAPDAEHAFRVSTEVGLITVLGTQFSVELQPKGQNTQGETTMKRAAMIMAVSVLAGSVSVDFNGSRSVLTMGQSQAFGDDKDAAPAVAATPATLPTELKGYSGTMNGSVVKAGTDSIVLKLSIAFKKMGLNDKEVDVVVKDVKDLPELKAGDNVYLTVAEVDGHLVAKTVFKAKNSR